MKKNKYKCTVYSYTLLVLGFNRNYSDMVVLDEIQGFATEEEAQEYYFENYQFPDTARISFDVTRQSNDFKIECCETVKSLLDCNF